MWDNFFNRWLIFLKTRIQSLGKIFPKLKEEHPNSDICSTTTNLIFEQSTLYCESQMFKPLLFKYEYKNMIKCYSALRIALLSTKFLCIYNVVSPNLNKNKLLKVWRFQWSHSGKAMFFLFVCFYISSSERMPVT